jgi:hypothetical protein
MAGTSAANLILCPLSLFAFRHWRYDSNAFTEVPFDFR